MALIASKSDSVVIAGNDVTALFSHFGDLAQPASYRELVREDAAVIAASRWPLLAEIEGIAPESVEATVK
jgi:hypothetical protein